MPGLALDDCSLEPGHTVVHGVQAGVQDAEQVLDALPLHALLLHHLLQQLHLPLLLPAAQPGWFQKL